MPTTIDEDIHNLTIQILVPRNNVESKLSRSALLREANINLPLKLSIEAGETGKLEHREK